VVVLNGLQGGNTKLCCLLCELDSRACYWHYHLEHWPLRRETILGEKKSNSESFSRQDENIFTSTSLLKLGLIKMSLNAMNKEGEGFDY
jgi:hypothetical protein